MVSSPSIQRHYTIKLQFIKVRFRFFQVFLSFLYFLVGKYLCSSNRSVTGGPLCIVNFVDFANFAEYWLQSGSDLPADLYEDSFVDYDDLLEFANVWLCICPYDWPLK